MALKRNFSSSSSGIPGSDDIDAFVAAAGSNDKVAVSRYLDMYSSKIIDARDTNGETALVFAAQKGHCDMVALLLDKGADINQKSGKNNDTALTKIARHGMYYDVFTLLLERGIDVNAKNDDDMTALHRTALGGAHGKAVLLLDKGADMNLQDNNGYTPLIIATMKNNAVADLLMEKGADTSLTDNYAKCTAAQWAKDLGIRPRR